ncbi:MAG: GH92 family glycosyl hydrolase [Kofleriaceae bacterium]|nr:GH92 family glycosyl hydrolase [Kofleriaceae bacterium]
MDHHRRHRRRSGVALAAWATLVGCGDNLRPSAPLVTDPLPLVDPRIGTGGLGFAYGSAFVGAATPSGLAKVGPDTSGPAGTIGFQHFSGYWADDDRLQAISHLHLHGAGVADYGVLAVLPVRSFDPTRTAIADYQVRYAKADEVARPGRYQLALASGIGLDVVATPRGALHTYQLGAEAGWVIIDLAKTLDGGAVDAAAITVDAATGTWHAELHHRGGMSGSYGGYTLYAAARLSGPWGQALTWADGAPTTAASARGAAVGAAIEVPAGGAVTLAVGLSLVSADGAAAALAAELPAGVDAATLVAQAEAAWRARLGVVRIAGGSERERRTFYTSLYQAFLMPTRIDDVDGTYQLAGGPVRVGAGAMLSDFSLWDTYRTVHPLYAWLAPDLAAAGARALTRFAEDLGAFPRWPIATGESGTMLGAPAEIVVADAVARGAADADATTRAWPLLRAAAMDPVAPAGGRGGREHVEPYQQLGYVPAAVGRSVSVTTEYAHADVALATLARAAGADADADTLSARSRGWRALHDPGTGFLRGRLADGRWAIADAEFDPLVWNADYAEANAWHSLWMVGLHDPAGLAEALGGADAAIARLEQFMSGGADEVAADPTSALPREYYWHGNEPALSAPYLFAQLGRPDLTQRWVAWVLDALYDDRAAGKAGNDDGGTLAAWYVWSALGLYPVAGTDRYVLGAPRFPLAEIDVGGQVLRIVGDGAERGDRYVAAVELDGVALTTPTLTHAQLRAARELRFTMSATPTSWGR